MNRSQNTELRAFPFMLNIDAHLLFKSEFSHSGEFILLTISYKTFNRRITVRLCRLLLKKKNNRRARASFLTEHFPAMFTIKSIRNPNTEIIETEIKD